MPEWRQLTSYPSPLALFLYRTWMKSMLPCCSLPSPLPLLHPIFASILDPKEESSGSKHRMSSLLCHRLFRLTIIKRLASRLQNQQLLLTATDKRHFAKFNKVPEKISKNVVVKWATESSKVDPKAMTACSRGLDFLDDFKLVVMGKFASSGHLQMHGDGAIGLAQHNQPPGQKTHHGHGNRHWISSILIFSPPIKEHCPVFSVAYCVNGQITRGGRRRKEKPQKTLAEKQRRAAVYFHNQSRWCHFRSGEKTLEEEKCWCRPQRKKTNAQSYS